MSGAAGILLSCIIACFIGFVLQKTTSVKITRASQRLKDSALVMSIEMNKAETAHAAYQKVQGEETKVKNEQEATQWKADMAKKKEEADAKKAGSPVKSQKSQMDRSTTLLLREQEQLQQAQQQQMQQQMMSQMNAMMMQKMMRDMMRDSPRDRGDRSRRRRSDKKSEKRETRSERPKYSSKHNEP